MMRPNYLMLVCLLIAGACNAQTTTDYTKYVDPFIGTGGHGHTFPGASVPFGMVQLSPDTRLTGWDGCSAYHYTDSKVYGFSHTHLSGTGCSDYGDLLILPTTGSKYEVKNKKYASSFSKSTEKAIPGYYSVKLDKYDILAELTTTTRTGLHKYTFPKGKQANIMIDLTHRDEVKQSKIEVVNDHEIKGMRLSKAWASDQYVYFDIQFSQPIASYSIAENNIMQKDAKSADGKNLKGFFTFNTEKDQVVYVKVGISAVSADGAKKNLEAEQSGWDFDKVKADAIASWNKELGKVAVESSNEKEQKVFYTAMYHAFLSPNVYQDVDGQYRGRDLKIHTAKDFTNYTVFSLWDTYRALHPLFTLIDRKRQLDFIQTFLVQYQQGGTLPVWELGACETNCMIGYHSVPVIVDAYMKGITGFDTKVAMDAMKKSAMEDRNGLRDYKTLGYIPFRADGENVSKTLEYAFDDWCISQYAKKAGYADDYKNFIKRGQNYKNLFDASSGFMRGRDGDQWYTPFDPAEVNHNYTEANAWQYSFYVPQDLSGLIKLYGSKEKLAAQLDALFAASSKLAGHAQSDISGLIGQYAHGNEPSHHIAYLYDYAGQPWKTQAMTRRIVKELYTDKPDGLAGNEDCGQMSGWLIFSAMGLYPVCPGADHYAIGSPLFDKVSMKLENGKTFTVKSSNGSDANVYIQSAKLNGTPYNKCFITYDDIMNGGTIEFTMGAEPNKAWGSGENDVPVTKIAD